MSYIVQIAKELNTTAGAAATATFAKALTAGNSVLVAVMAIDTGAAVGSDGTGTSSVSLSDTLSLSFQVNPGDATPQLVGDRTNGYSYLTGFYNVNSAGALPGGSEAITFTFTPQSIASKCVVGIVAYEINNSSNLANDTTKSPTPISNTAPVCSNLIGGLTLNAPAMYVVCGVCVTTDGSAINGGGTVSSPPSGTYTLDAVGNPTINGVKTSMAIQSFLTNTNNLVNANDVAFGNSPSSAAVVSSAGSGTGVALASAPAYLVTGNAGVANALVSYSGTASGNTTAAADGSFTLLLAPGTYTITPTLTGYVFTPANQNETVSSAPISSVNFTAAQGGAAVGWSPVDSRVAVKGFGPGANTGIVDAQGNKIFSAQDPPFSGNSQTSSNAAIPPTDSRAAGAPVDSRVNKPVNSRASRV